MQEFNKDLVADMLEGGEEKKSLVGNVVVLPGETVDALRAIDAFKPTQGWGLFNKPGLLIRQESVELTRALVSAEDEKSTLRYVIEGSKGSGKSMMLLHAQAVAVARGWVVLHFPEAQELVNAVNDYAAIPNSNPSVWMQPTYTAEWLEKIAKANPILDTIKMTQPHNLPIEIPKGTTLGRLCELGVRDSDIAFPLFQALWSELNQSGRPPILLTLDGLSYIMRDSQYRNTNNELIHSHDLALIKHFTDFLSGSQTMKNGGAVIGATSRSHHPISLSMNLAITQALEKQQESPQTERQPFEKNYDERVEASLKDVHVMKLSGTSKDEARGLMEYWAKSGVLRQTVDERSVAEKWALAGNGVLGELQRGALRMRI
ncbi:putative 37S ribosomal protein S23, mitochondrial [Glarea lozoyensis 74030]|nr:putative 37S ribosomal protein S23, mitochondrial [Glarea lozoyensis 74030]